MTKLDLLIFKESLFVFSQVSTCANSVFMILSRQTRLLWQKNKLESSANKCKSKELVQLQRSLI